MTGRQLFISFCCYQQTLAVHPKIQPAIKHWLKANNFLLKNLPYGRHVRKTFLLDLASGVVCHAPDITIGPVSSYLAFSPLPQINGEVYFLWHFQSIIDYSISSRALPGTLFFEVRTFLLPMDREAIARIELLDYSLLMN